MGAERRSCVPVLESEGFRGFLIEGLLPEGLIRCLYALYPQHSRLESTAPAWFTEKNNYTGIAGFFGLPIDLERIKRDRPHIVKVLHGVSRRF